jgi:hypothetical protein
MRRFSAAPPPHGAPALRGGLKTRCAQTETRLGNLC